MTREYRQSEPDRGSARLSGKRSRGTSPAGDAPVITESLGLSPAARPDGRAQQEDQQQGRSSCILPAHRLGSGWRTFLVVPSGIFRRDGYSAGYQPNGRNSRTQQQRARPVSHGCALARPHVVREPASKREHRGAVRWQGYSRTSWRTQSCALICACHEPRDMS